LAGTSLLVLAACGGSQDAVGANSPDSITTTAVGNVVATVPSPTPTPDDAISSGDNMAAADATMSNDSVAGNAM
jgi:hypothetical protein